MTTTKRKKKNTIKWDKSYSDTHYSYMHIVRDSDYRMLPNERPKHMLLLLMNDLGLLLYERGYDGIYYDILIKIRE